MAEINEGYFSTKTAAIVSSGANPTSGTGGTIKTAKKNKKKKGSKPPAIDYADPNGLIAAKLNAAQYVTWDDALGRYKVVSK